MTTTFDVLSNSYRELANSERMKGNCFEQLADRYLEQDGIQALRPHNGFIVHDRGSGDGFLSVIPSITSELDLLEDALDVVESAIGVRVHEEARAEQSDY